MQGRFKRDDSGPAEPEPRGGTDRGSSPQHAQNPGPVSVVSNGDNGAHAHGAAPAPTGPQGPSGGPPGPGGTPPPAPKPKAKDPVGPGSRIALRNWRISTRLVSLLALPVVAATSLGAVRINQSMDDIQRLDNMRLLTDITKQAIQLATALQKERDQTAGPLANGVKGTDLEIKSPRARTDRARDAFLQGTKAVEEAGDREGLEGVNASVQAIAGQLMNLSKTRANAFQDPEAYSTTVDEYNGLVEELLALSQDMAQATSNPEMVHRTRALAAFASSKEYSSMQRAIIAASLPPNKKSRPKISELDRSHALNLGVKADSELRSFEHLYQNNAELLRPIDGQEPGIKESDYYADRLLPDKDGAARVDPRSYKDWLDESNTKIDAMAKIERTLLDEMEQKARELRNESERGAIISGALILLVLGVSLVGAFVVARSMIRSLRRLQDTATRVAQDRLPELIKQLSEADPQDVDTSVESVGVHSRDEIGQVAAAFDDVHREAVRLAAEQALLRGNVNAMFTNLSRRSQGLIQRQLSLISELESREADPDQLSSLFKLDHLATRMRRNGENLLVLAGEEPGRRWTRPVPLVDVLRAAASEVEQYERIELSSVPGTEVAGRVVNDLVHLLAELLENATSFSSPQTKVKVTGHALPDGRVLIEIHDTGIGLSPEDLAAINERLASPPIVDVSVSRRMGLFVVGRLSQRHGIRIQLRPSDSGGTTALVMLPVDVAQGGKRGPVGKPGGPGAPGGGAPAGFPGGGPATAQASLGAPAARQNRPGGQNGPGLPGGPRTALPGAARPGGGAGGPQGRPAPGAGGFGQGGQPSGAGRPGARPQGGQPPVGAPFGGGRQDGFSGGDAFDGFGHRSGGPADSRPGRPERGPAGQPGPRPQLPARGGPRAELPGAGTHGETPRGHEEPGAAPSYPRFDERPGGTAALPAVDGRGPGGTPEFPRSGGEAPRQDSGFTRPGEGQDGPFVRSDVFGAPADQGGAQGPADTGQFPAVQPTGYDDRGRSAPGYGQGPADTGQFPRPVTETGAYELPARTDGYDGSGQDTGQYERPSHDTGPYQRPGQDTGSYERPAPTGTTGPYDRTAHETGAYERPAHETGQYERPGQDTGQYERPGQDDGPYQRPSHDTGQYERPGQDTGSYERPAPADTTGQYERPAYGQPQGFQGPGAGQPVRPQGDSLPPAGPGDGRTPLFDTLETDWFRGQRADGQPSDAGRPASGAPEHPSLPEERSGADQDGRNAPEPGAAPGSWRTSPNDELVRQAERVRQPSAGGVTTSGLPRRVPRANLVAGTAQQQQHQPGQPQVSRAPDDVRGRLTNLRRGIQQGRQAGNGPSTGSHPRPTHQQEH
ncbi:nitrate- and nitrite sensing domain-containing protein [Streptomyces sp. JNUCC 64]